MQKLHYTIQQGEAVNRWLTLGVFQTPKIFEEFVQEGGINDWLLEGFAIHEYPGRKQFLKERKPASPLILFPQDEVYAGLSQLEQSWQLHTPFGNPLVEKEGFWDTPTHIEARAYAEWYAEKEKDYSFQVYTCGGIQIWVNGELSTSFAPFTRNELSSTTMTCRLQKGRNRVEIYYDDLAERDTKFSFRLDYQDKTPLQVVLPIGEHHADEMKHIEALLTQAYFPRDTFTSEDIYLQWDSEAETSFTMSIAMQVERCQQQYRSYLINQGDTEVRLGKVEDFQMGYTAIEVRAVKGAIAISKPFGIEIFPIHLSPSPADSVQERKKQALAFTSKYGEPNIHKLAAMLSQTPEEQQQDLLESIMQLEMDLINNRGDCSDFSLVMFLKMLYHYPDHPMMTEERKANIKQMVLNFRYWMDEPGNDVMWFYSENHALMFHTCELLAGQLWGNEWFVNAGIQGEEHYNRAEERLNKWFDRFFSEGLLEWNSAPYMPINVIGLITLYDLAAASHIRVKAKTALDRIFRWLALNSYHGFLTCSQGRVYEKELKGNYNTQTTNLSWIAWGQGVLNYATFGSVSLSLSSYRPPETFAAYMRLPAGQSLLYRNSQGQDGYVNLYTYKEATGMLSSALQFKEGEAGYQEHVIQASMGPEANVWINHPGEISVQGNGRPSYWAGNGVLPKVAQHESLAIVLFNIDHHEVDFTHAYVPTFAFDEVVQENSWFFLRKENHFLAVYANNGFTLTKEGINRQRELISPGRKNVWILRMGSAATFASFAEFQTYIQSARVQVNQHNLEISYQEDHIGNCRFGWSDPLTIQCIQSDQELMTIDGEITIKNRGECM
ncbi:hypothetical protein [Gracilibacillus phocaeensis]|uniref:hypothetical protein n=1 Tax=Gracilibacillus phocaeensis TaxID=2042304 RepID=UPI00102FF4B3|nr:hypothetical protein [Gracilibacillus phocaeensis]